MAGIPDFLQKYLSYNPPSQEKYINQMNNVPDFLQKYIGGSVELEKETTSQPTMGELGYHEQKQDFTNPIVWEQYIVKQKRVPTLGDVLQLVKLRLRKDFKANIPVYTKSGYRMESPFQKRLDKVSDAAGIALLLYATGQTLYATAGLRKMALGNLQNAVSIVKKEVGKTPTLNNIEQLYVQMRKAPTGTYSKDAIESADYLLNLRNSLMARNPARSPKFGYSFKEMLNNYLANLPYFGSTPLPRKLKFKETPTTIEEAANNAIPNTSVLGQKALAKNISTEKLANDPTFLDKLNIVNTLIREKEPLAVKLFGDTPLSPEEFLAHYNVVKNSQSFRNLINMVNYFQSKTAPLRIIMSKPQIAETAKQALQSTFKSVLNPTDLQNLTFILFPTLQKTIGKVTSKAINTKQAEPKNTVNLVLYRADTGMGKLTHITYATGHPEIAKTYGANVKAYKVSLPGKNILHIDYKMPTNPLYDYSYKIVDGRKIDFHLITPEDKKFLLDRGYKAIDVTKIDTDGKKIPHFEFVALDKSILKPIKKEVLPPEIPKEPSIIKTTQTFLQKYHKGTTTDILGTPDYEALKEVKQPPEKTLEILRKDYAKIQKNIDTAEQIFLDNKIDALTARKKIAEQLQLIKKLKTLNPYGKNEKINQLNDKALKYAKAKLDKIKLTKTSNSLSKQEQEELTKKGLTNLQPNNNFVYIGVRSPETLKKILKAGKLKVDKTSEKMGIFGSHHLAIAKDYAKKTGIIFKIPYDKTTDISDKIDKRLKQVRLNKDIDLSKAFVKVGNKWVKFTEYKKKVQPIAKKQVEKSPVEQALQKDVKIEDEAKRSGNISLSLLKEVKSKLADFFVTANKLRENDINLWYTWREQMFKVNASVEKWITLFEKHMKGYWTPISAKDDYDMAILFDAGEKPMFTGDKLKMYNRMAELNKKLEEYKLKKDLTGKFQDADITLLDEQIAELEKKGTAKALAKANELSQLRDKIAKMNYLPRKAILNKYWGASPEKREAFLKKLKNTDLLSSSYKHRKSKSLLAELVNKGVLQPEDIGFIEMTVENYVETGMKEAMRETYQIFEKNGMIQKASNELKLQGWVSPYKLGIKDPYLKEKLFHPALAQAFEQYIASQKPHNWLLRILGIVKVAQFIKPNIVWFYDIAQVLFRGLYSFNPVVNGKLMKQALESVKNKDDLYLHLLEKGLYPMPEGIPNKVLAEEYRRFARRHITDVSQFKKTLEMLAGHTITTKDKDLFDIAMEIPRIYVDPLAKATWQGDKIMRTFGYLQAKRMGYDDDKAIRITREALGDYSVLSHKYKELASYIFFVYAFRILMPVEMTKTLFIEPMRFLIKKITGNDPPKGEAERILKALLGFFALVYIPYQVMKHFGFRPTGKHLGPLAWKYAKPVLYKGKKKEIVVGYNNIVNMPIKYWNRFTSYDPTNPTSPFLQVIWRVGKWEIQPLYRIAIEIAFNKPSFSTKPYVYNENDPWGKQVADMAKYLFEQSFRFYATLDDLTSSKTSYAKQQQEIIDTNMKLFEKILVNTFGYAYVRSSRDYIKKIMLTQLKAERTKRLHKIFKNYTGDKRKNEIDKLNSWYKRSLQYINKHY